MKGSRESRKTKLVIRSETMTNAETNPNTANGGLRQESWQKVSYNNSLTLYHASANLANGSAVSFELHPASRRGEGYFFMTLVPQKEELQIRPGSGNRKVASFDWNGQKVSVKLGFSDICALLSVFRGEAEEVGDGRGLLHDSKDATTAIYFSSKVKDRPGAFSLAVSRKLKAGGDPVRLRILLSPQEALGLKIVFEQSLFPMAFGQPVEFQSSRQGDSPAVSSAAALDDFEGDAPF